jgi:hypothetical protein
MELLERAAAMQSLEESLASARRGAGSLVLVGGEAGIGKSTLARAFCSRHAAGTQVLWGGCDALRTPRPLGPLRDIARSAGGDLVRMMAADTARHALFTAFLDLLCSRDCVVVIEDLHWADAATLDLVVFVAAAPDGAAAPYTRQIAGDWQGGYELWRALGCRYEAAEALADSPVPADRVAALRELHDLGAWPAAERLGMRLRAEGVGGLPRRPRPATMANPGRLTSRELDVLALLDLRNRDIAAGCTSRRRPSGTTSRRS